VRGRRDGVSRARRARGAPRGGSGGNRRRRQRGRAGGAAAQIPRAQPTAARTRVLGGSGRLPAAERPAMGALANEVKGAVTDALGARTTALQAAVLERVLVEDRVDVTLPGRARPRGHVHPLRTMEDEMVDIF